MDHKKDRKTAGDCRASLGEMTRLFKIVYGGKTD
jgi:hypothetical protein